MKCWFLAGALAMLATPGLAVSGSELLAGGKIAEGYAWGIVEYRWQVDDDDDPNMSAEQQKIFDCLSNGKITSGAFIEVVKQTIKNDPKLMPAPGVQAVLLTLNEMCPVDD